MQSQLKKELAMELMSHHSKLVVKFLEANFIREFVRLLIAFEVVKNPSRWLLSITSIIIRLLESWENKREKIMKKQEEEQRKQRKQRNQKDQKDQKDQKNQLSIHFVQKVLYLLKR